ncbi:hypothetical protein AKJ41_06000 [candidate division MSBL1 archaeon SCGC-AAA259O05]|uniref:Uncharacterized protein n=1 Tax=candidate division MSBL1 archaeon SCGC-AAA259O05 TaxID=1698271 RepID=A0A133UY09_9EURY|nr:hypothetical protein AKJ41_06000 [candidate division MSBL1 archaeon SCGC-AAA259O05]
MLDPILIFGRGFLPSLDIGETAIETLGRICNKDFFKLQWLAGIFIFWTKLFNFTFHRSLFLRKDILAGV